MLKTAIEAHKVAANGWAMFNAGNYPAALREFRDALAINPETISALEGMSHAHLRLNQIREAEIATQSLASLAPDRSNTHLIRAQILRLKKKSREALGAADNALNLDPNNARAHLMKSWALEDLEKWKLALAAATEARRLEPSNAQIVAQLAEITLAMKGPKAAEPIAREALRLNFECNTAQSAMAHVAIVGNDLATAREIAAAMLRRDANNKDAIFLYLLADRKKYSLLREKVRFQCWRRRRPVLGTLAVCAWVLMLLLTGAAIVAGARAPGIGMVLVYLAMLRFQYERHKRAVKMHFAQAALKRGF
jgi:tetratricopeptide (TPR) repeat protein